MILLGSDAEAAARLMHSPMSIPLSARTMAGASMGSPLIISPARHLMPQQPHHAYSNSSPAAAPPPLIPAESAAGLLYATAYDAYHHHLATLAAHQHLLGDVSYPTTTTANNGDGMHVSGMISLANRWTFYFVDCQRIDILVSEWLRSFIPAGVFKLVESHYMLKMGINLL